MIARLVLREAVRGKIRCLAAAVGVAAAAGCLVFTAALNSTNSAQGEKRAARIAAPWQAWLAGRPAAGADLSIAVAPLALDYRPDGRVLQGPPLVARLAHSPSGNIYGNAAVSGEMPQDSAAVPQVVVSKAMLRGNMPLPEIGSMLSFSTAAGVVEAKVCGHLALPGALPRALPLPNGYMNAAFLARLPQDDVASLSLWSRAADAPDGAESVASIAPRFATDAQRNFGRADLLMLWGAILSALALIVNTLLLSLDANRAELVKLRLAGMSRAGVLKFVCAESLALGVAGWIAGTVAARISLSLFVAANAVDFPEGAVFGKDLLWTSFGATVAVSLAATLLIVRRALAVKPLESASPVAKRKRVRHLGMAIAFGTGFAAFTAVFVWGESLMKSFVPSPEWPDAIVSILPGVQKCDIARLSSIEGVKRIEEIQPFQAPFSPVVQMEGPQNRRAAKPAGRRPRAWNCENALLIGCNAQSLFSMAPLRFVEGDAKEAAQMLAATNACVITKMMADARHLKKGDFLKLDTRPFDKYGVETALPIAGVVDLNWHMVTSRGKLRGLNGAPVMTAGPAFVSFDTVDGINPVPSLHAKTTHLWLDYTDEFLAAHTPLEAGRLVEEGVKAALDASSCEVQLHARDEIADGTLAHGSDIIGTLAKVPYIFLVVLSIGFVAQISGACETRKFEFRALRAAGATRGQIARLLAKEAMGTALAGIVWGAAAGSLAGYLATIGTRSAMAQWGIPPAFVFPAGKIAFGAAVALAVCCLQCAIGTLCARGKNGGVNYCAGQSC